jgi:TetR/AcrR family transcriptional regulator
MPAAERRAMILETARDLFGRNGYHGTTTDQIAAAAGISQPYVVRMFGSKEALFLEVLRSALDTLMAAWRSSLVELRAAGATPKEQQIAIGEQFIAMAAHRGLHTTLLQAFTSGAEPAIGAAARDGFLEIYRFLRDELGAGDDDVHGFLSTGMLFSVMLAIGMPGRYDEDPDAAELLRATFGAKCGEIVEAARARS